MAQLFVCHRLYSNGRSKLRNCCYTNDDRQKGKLECISYLFSIPKLGLRILGLNNMQIFDTQLVVFTKTNQYSHIIKSSLSTSFYTEILLADCSTKVLMSNSYQY